MNTCLECSAPLSKRQKKFCSCSCMNKHNAVILDARRRIENPHRYRECPECSESKPIHKFSRIDKNDASKGYRSVCKKCSHRIRQKEYRERDWRYNAVNILYKNTKARAKKSGIPFTLEKSDVVIPDLCPVFGIPLKREDRETWYSAPSIDRIDNTKGYLKENIIIVSRRANILKRDATIEEMIQLTNFYKRYLL